jgi:hypothetical protein
MAKKEGGKTMMRTPQRDWSLRDFWSLKRRRFIQSIEFQTKILNIGLRKKSTSLWCISNSKCPFSKVCKRRFSTCLLRDSLLKNSKLMTLVINDLDFMKYSNEKGRWRRLHVCDLERWSWDICWRWALELYCNPGWEQDFRRKSPWDWR